MDLEIPNYGIKIEKDIAYEKVDQLLNELKYVFIHQCGHINFILIL